MLLLQFWRNEFLFYWYTECQYNKSWPSYPLYIHQYLESLYGFYLVSNNQAIRAFVIQEGNNGLEQPIHNVNHTFKDFEACYLGAEWPCLASIYVVQRLQHNFLAHQLYLMTKSHLINSLLQCLIHFGKLAQSLLQSSKSETIFKSPKLIKSQATTALLIRFMWEACSFISDKIPIILQNVKHTSPI